MSCIGGAQGPLWGLASYWDNCIQGYKNDKSTDKGLCVSKEWRLHSLCLFSSSECCGWWYVWKSNAHQPPLAARPRTYLLQTGSYDVSIHPRHLSVIPTVMFHPSFRYDIQTTAAVFYLTSSGLSAGSSLYSRKAGVSGFGCHRLERPASPRRICAATRGFQTTQDLSVFPLLPRYYHMTCVLLSPFITTVWIPVVLAIINII